VKIVTKSEFGYILLTLGSTEVTVLSF